MGGPPARSPDQTEGTEQEPGGESGAESDLPAVEPGRYTVEAQIGEGGLGKLMRARDLRLKRIVAIKLMRRLSTRLEARFRREAEITARLQHPGIVPIHEVGRWSSGEPYYAMKLISGSSLKQLLAEAKTLEARLPLLRKLLAVCEAIGYAHSESVIHRDLKPSNIMIGAFGEAMVIDWGLAKVIGTEDLPSDGDLGAAPPSATSTGVVVGTPAYMPPEQARGEALDRRADVYALGAVLYELLAGRPPYDGATALEVTRAVIAQAPPPLAERAREAPRELIAIAEKAIARAPDDRYADAGALAEDLRRFLDGQLVRAHHYSTRQRLARVWRRHRAVVSVATASALALMVSGAWSVRRIVVERSAAEQAQARAEAESANLLLAQARLWMDRDPTAALAWLKKYARTAHPDGDQIATLAADARARGAARQRVLDRKLAVVAPDGRTLAAVTGDALVTWTIDDATARELGKLDGAVTGLAFSVSGSVFSAEGGKVRARPIAGGPVRDLVSGDERVVLLAGAGPSLIAGGERGTLWIFDPLGHVRSIATRPAPFDDFTVSRDGSLLLAHRPEEGLSLWRLPSGERLPLEAPRTAEGKRTAVARDGRRVAWGDDQGVVHVVDVAGGQERALKGPKGQVQRLAFSDDGTHLASTAADASVRVWDLSSGEARVLSGHTNWTKSVAFSPDGGELVSASLDRTLRVWDLATGDCQVLRGQNGNVVLAQFTHDERDLITADSQGEVRVWPVVRPTERVLRGTPTYGITLRFWPTGELLSSDDSGTHTLYAVDGSLIRRVKAPVGQSAIGIAEASTDDGQLAIIGNAEGKVMIVDPVKSAVRAFSGHDGAIYSAETSHDRKRAATAGADRTIRIWDLAAGTQKIVGRHPQATWHATFSPDDKLLASAGDDLELRIWDLERGTSRLLAGHSGLVYRIGFSPDGRWLASAGVDATVRLWNPADGTARVLAGHSGPVQSLDFSPDGHLLASGGDDQTVRLWDLGSGASRVLDHGTGVVILRFSPDGSWLATGGTDGTVRLWDVSRASLRAVWRGGSAALVELAFSHDGKRLAAGADDGSIRLWSDLQSEPRAPATAGELAALGSVELMGEQVVSPDGLRRR